MSVLYEGVQHLGRQQLSPAHVHQAAVAKRSYVGPAQAEGQAGGYHRSHAQGHQPSLRGPGREQVSFLPLGEPRRQGQTGLLELGPAGRERGEVGPAVEERVVPVALGVVQLAEPLVDLTLALRCHIGSINQAAFSFSSDSSSPCTALLSTLSRKYPTIAIMKACQARPSQPWLPVLGLKSWAFCPSIADSRGALRLGRTAWTAESICSRRLPSMKMMKKTCRCTLMTALPSAVASRNLQKGNWKCPQRMPAMSKRGFGMEARATIVMKPCRSRWPLIASLLRSMKVRFCFLSSWTMSSAQSCSPAFEWARATKQGGSSPRAVPKPHSMTSSCTACRIARTEGYWPVGVHSLKYSSCHLLGRNQGTLPQLQEAIATLAMWGPRQRTNVCNPVPRPIELATPRMTQYPTKQRTDRRQEACGSSPESDQERARRRRRTRRGGSRQGAREASLGTCLAVKRASSLKQRTGSRSRLTAIT